MGKKYFRKGAAIALHPEGVRLDGSHNQKDAIVFLRHGRTDIINRLKDGSLKSPDSAHLYLLLALATLSGEAL